jgi:hypothetical protein
MPLFYHFWMLFACHTPNFFGVYIHHKETVMKNNIKLVGVVALSVLGFSLSTTSVHAQKLTLKMNGQESKNLMRNMGLGLAAGAIDAARRGDTDKALLLGAGAALSGKKYEDHRHAQNNQTYYRKQRAYSKQHGHSGHKKHCKCK